MRNRRISDAIRLDPALRRNICRTLVPSAWTISDVGRRAPPRVKLLRSPPGKRHDLYERSPISDDYSRPPKILREPLLHYHLHKNDPFAVERHGDQIARLPRSSGLTKAAGGEMALGLFAGRRRGKPDGESAAVRVRALADDVDCRADGHERRQRHAAEPGLIGLERGRTAGDEACGKENDKGPDHPARLRAASRFCLARLPQTSISHHRRRLFLVVSQKSQPQAWPSQRLMRETSPSVNSLTAASAIGPSAASTGATSTLQTHRQTRPSATSVAHDRKRACRIERSLRAASGGVAPAAIAEPTSWIAERKASAEARSLSPRPGFSASSARRRSISSAGAADAWAIQSATFSASRRWF